MKVIEKSSSTFIKPKNQTFLRPLLFTLFSLCLISTYYALFSFLFTKSTSLDFPSFYSALLSLNSDGNPYHLLFSNFLEITKALASNLNPPFVLWFFSPLAKLSYQSALLLWTGLSFCLGYIGAYFAFYYAFSEEFFKKNKWILSFFYFASFPTLLNTTLGQMGSFLLFFIMMGYHFYHTKREGLAGFCWGLITAFKLFPALLFFYLIHQQRYRLFWIMLSCFICFSLVPLLAYGTEIYSQYLHMLRQVFWYGDNWNASIYGYISRLFLHHPRHKASIEILYLILFIVALVWYLQNLHCNRSQLFQPQSPREKPISKFINHQPFCLTLTMMLLMSPLGWIYYFPLLIFPLCLSWSFVLKKNKPYFTFLWLVGFFAINLPQSYVVIAHMADFSLRISTFSFYFYGLMILNYLVAQKKIISGDQSLKVENTQIPFLYTTFFIVFFSALVTMLKLCLD